MHEPWRWHWGNWVKARAKYLGLQLKDVAAAAGTTPRNLSKWLANEEMPAMRHKYRDPLAKALEVHPLLLSSIQQEHHPEDPGPIDHYLKTTNPALTEAEIEEIEAQLEADDVPTDARLEYLQDVLISTIKCLDIEGLRKLAPVVSKLMHEMVERALHRAGTSQDKESRG